MKCWEEGSSEGTAPQAPGSSPATSLGAEGSQVRGAGFEQLRAQRLRQGVAIRSARNLSGKQLLETGWKERPGLSPPPGLSTRSSSSSSLGPSTEPLVRARGDEAVVHSELDARTAAGASWGPGRPGSSTVRGCSARGWLVEGGSCCSMTLPGAWMDGRTDGRMLTLSGQQPCRAGT